jgi:hypothetical protein
MPFLPATTIQPIVVDEPSTGNQPQGLAAEWVTGFAWNGRQAWSGIPNYPVKIEELDVSNGPESGQNPAAISTPKMGALCRDISAWQHSGSPRKKNRIKLSLYCALRQSAAQNISVF